jgi:hypothetical protein
LPQEMPGIDLKTLENRIDAARHGVSAAGAGNPEGASIFSSRHQNRATARATPVRRHPGLVRIAASAYNRPKKLSSIARRADTRVTHAACMVTEIDPRLLST